MASNFAAQQSPGGAGSGDDPKTGSESNKSSSSRSPFSGLSFLKNLGGEKKTRDGQPAKRRGPKPDSKPALTKRQELNRQAQRTHRERKEMYIRALEQEVLNLKENAINAIRERDKYFEENRKLRELLALHGINYDPSAYNNPYGTDISAYGTGSIQSGPATASGLPRQTTPSVPGSDVHGQQYSTPSHHGLDYDQIGIDFVLTLERPCMDHMIPLMVQSYEGEADGCGHVFLATLPTQSRVVEHANEPHKFETPPDVPMPDLIKLLDLSNRLPLDGEITPIMAWASIRGHPRAPELKSVDYAAIKENLSTKVRCHGFGAVLEDFELRDAINAVLPLSPPIATAF